MRIIASIILLLAGAGGILATDSAGSELQRLRQGYYRALQGEVSIDSVIAGFERYAEQEPSREAVMNTYIGSLTGFKATQVFWPQAKFKWANRGLELMDRGLDESNGDLEALFIHASTCYHLPFFFKRQEGARSGFRELAVRLPEERESVDDSLFVHITEFLDESDMLTEQEMAPMLGEVQKIEREREGQPNEG
ncbi:hypothetical protein KQI63_00470 [bacterium]|nr:hypothetical protein [bacterium]